MSKQSIIIIIALMSLALLGTSIIQFTWIKRAVDIQAESFDNNVMDGLNSVHEQLIDYQRQTKEIMKAKDTGKNFKLSVRDYETKDLAYKFNPNRYIEDIAPETLDRFVKNEFQNRGIDIRYDYGLYSNKTRSFSILNGQYAVEYEDAPMSSEVELSDQGENQSLYRSKYSINLFPNESELPGQLKVYFPNKTRYLWSSSWISILSSLIFTGLILFCFIYTINVILFQKKVSEMKTDFINNMTHEFKTPIATISLAADSIKSPKVNGNIDKVNRFANIIKQENKRMLGQVEKVLQMAQIDKSEFQLKISEIDVHTLVKNAAEHSRLKVNKRDGNIEVDLGAEKSVIRADQNHISNVIHNLLDNAEKYSSEAPQIKIKTENVSNGINIIISDKGIGMTKEALKSIFEKFYRVHTGNLHNVKGFGLGLSYVKASVNAHQGRINVESEPGNGSTFTIFLPFSASDSD